MLGFAFAWTFAVFSLAAPSARADETEHVSKTLRLEPGGTLRLKSFSGRVTITASDRSEVVIDAVRRGTRERLDHIKLDITTEGPTTVVVDANHRDPDWRRWFENNTVVETDFDIKVPRHTNLNVNVFSASVSVEGVEGNHSVHGFSSHVSLDDVRGSIQAHTFSGSVEIRAKGWQDGQNVDIDTFSGSVTLHVPDTARGTVTFNSFSGRLNSEMPLILHSSNRHSLRAELGANASSGGNLRFKTFSGSVQIDRQSAAKRLIQ
jgi:DUF4097 and DUF4098 domain-containing protein YvlB